LAERAGNLERLAMLDQLTELPNRRYLEMNLALRVSELQRYGWPFGVLLIDIDHFKQVNDTYGHEVGDKTLKMVARTLSYSSRVFDVVGRWGGEEFLAIVSHIEPAQLWNVAERLRVMIGQSILEVQEGLVQVTASIGATMAEPSEELDRVLRRADRRLYEAKRAGRDRVVAADPGEEAPRHEQRPYEIIEPSPDARSGAGRKA
jgi:diguanylate cyclase (GGDEF)-like protein